MSAEQLTVAVVGAGGKMGGMRVSRNLQKSTHNVFYSENSPPAGQERVRAEGRDITATDDAVPTADVVILAVPDTVLGIVSEAVVPQMKSGAILLTLDPAAAYAGLLAKRDDVVQAVAHPPCHPSVFLERTTKEEWADTFGGQGAPPQNVVSAIDDDAPAATRDVAEAVIRTIYAPVIDVHWVTVKQLAILEPTLVETVACMIGTLLNEALHETVHTAGVPRKRRRQCCSATCRSPSPTHCAGPTRSPKPAKLPSSTARKPSSRTTGRRSSMTPSWTASLPRCSSWMQ